MKIKARPALFALLIAALFAGDIYLSHINPIKDSNVFVLNDFEITQRRHPEKIWDKVFFGNSVVISSYNEDISESGYINCGLDYGVVTDLWDMIRKHYVTLGSELVIGLNYLTLYDNFDTNPTYIWHKRSYQPYAYFERDRFYPIITTGFDNLLNGKSPMPMTYLEQSKSVYHGRVSDGDLRSKMTEYDDEFFNKPLSDYSENIAALEKVIKYCKKNNIRVRAVWMPWNPMFEKPQIVQDVREAADRVFEQWGVETLDMEDKYPSEYFYDTGHLNYDVGTVLFTQDMDSWL